MNGESNNSYLEGSEGGGSFAEPSLPLITGPQAKPQIESKQQTIDNPEEEYFRLMVLSIKIIQSEKDPEFGAEINSRKLFKLAKKEKIPFHKWFFWIDKRIAEASKE
jgi:hypothetical protein